MDRTQRFADILLDIGHVATTRIDPPPADSVTLALTLIGHARRIAQGEQLRLRLVVIAAEAVLALERYDALMAQPSRARRHYDRMAAAESAARQT